jgi:hypothetical protein
LWTQAGDGAVNEAAVVLSLHWLAREGAGRRLSRATQEGGAGKRGELGQENSGECHRKVAAQVAAWLAKRSEQRQVAAASVVSWRKKRRNKGKEERRVKRAASQENGLHKVGLSYPVRKLGLG